MAILQRARLWIRALLRRTDVERDLDRELQFHLDAEIEHRVRAGMSLAEARRAARLAFGGIERHKESVRDELGTRLIDELATDVRLACRAFRARPGFAATAAITMAIGIAASTSVFSLANWIFVRPVPAVSAPSEIVRVDLHHATGDAAQPSIAPAGLSYPNFVDLQRSVPALRGLAGSTSISVQFAAATSAAANLQGSLVVGDYFGTLGVHPEAGRFFDAAERDPANDARVAVISDSVWRAAFDRDAGVVGRTVRMNGVAFSVIGVAPRDFHGIDRVGAYDIWVPAGAYATIAHNARIHLDDRRLSLFMDLFGRLERGATPSIAEQQLRASLHRLAVAFPADNEILKDYLAFVTADLGLVGYRRQAVSDTLRLLGVVAAIVLLISCANAANLLLLRGVGRRSELAVRRALGATAGRLLRQQLAEGVVLGLLGGIAGVALTFAFRAVLREQRIPGFPALAGIPFDWRVMGFAFVLALLTGVAFALLPAFLAGRADFVAQLKHGAAIGGTGLRLRRMLVIVQIAACTSLVVAGALLGRTLRALHAVDLGFDADRTMAFFVDPGPQGYDAARVSRLRAELLQSVSTIAGIDDVTIASSPPMSGATFYSDVRPAGYAGTDWPVKAATVWIQPAYFSTLRIPVEAGNVPDGSAAIADSAAPDRVVVDRTLARALFGNENPIGRSIVQRSFHGPATHVIAAVVGDIHTTGLRHDADRVLYLPMPGMPFQFAAVLVHTSRPLTEIDRAVRKAMQGVDPTVPISWSAVMSDAVAKSISAERLFARILTLLAFLTAILTVAGIYGIIAYAVAERTREIGIRVALGATTASVVSLVTVQVGGMVVAGLAVGAVMSVWLSKLLASKLFGVTPLDPSSYAFAAVFLMTLGVIAAVSPARAATRVNPVEALRHE